MAFRPQAQDPPIGRPEPREVGGRKSGGAPHLQTSMSLFDEPAPPNRRSQPSRVTQGSLSLTHEAAARQRPQSATPCRNFMRGTQAIPSYVEGKMELSSTSSELKHHGAQYTTATTRAANRTLLQGTATYGDHVRVAAVVDPFGRPVAATTTAAWEPAPKPALATMAARRAVARATTASDLPHHGAAYATATVRAENKTLARGTQLQACMTMTEKTQRTWGHKNAHGRDPPFELRGTTHSELKNHGDYSTATVRAANKSLTPGTQALMTLTDHSVWGHADDDARKAVRAHQTARLNTGASTHDDFKNHGAAYGTATQRAANKTLSYSTQTLPNQQQPMRATGSTAGDLRHHGNAYGTVRAENKTLARGSGQGVPGELTWGSSNSTPPARPTTAGPQRCNPSLTSTFVFG